MKLATQDKPFLSEKIDEKLMEVKALGFDAYEIDGGLLLNRFDEVKTAVRKTGLPISSVCGGYRGWIGDFDEAKRKQAVSDISLILERASELGAKGVVVPAAWGMFSLRLPPMVPPRSPGDDRAALLSSLEALNKMAETTGTKVYLEPLNRYEDHMINTLEAARTLIDDGGFGHVQIAADFFHMNIEEKNVAESIRKYQAYIGHVHLADSHRYQPGDGHLDFVGGFRALKEIGYHGCMAFECRVLGEDPFEAYGKSVLFIRDCMEKAG